jgi:hypothetical protein
MNDEINNNIEKYFLDIVLHLIGSNESFAKDFKALLPDEIKSKVDSYRANKNCSCKGNLTNFAGQNRQLVLTFIKNFIKDNPNLSLDFIKNIENSYKNLDVSGKIFRIPKNEVAFQNFIQYTKTERYVYKSFSILEENNQWVIFFI